MKIINKIHRLITRFTGKKLTNKQLGIIVLVIVAGFWFLAGAGSEEVVEKETVITRVETIAVGDNAPARVAAVASGEVESLAQVELKSEVFAKVHRNHVALGDDVYAGQLLVSFNAADLSARLAQAQADLEGIQAAYTQAQAGLEAQQATLADIKAGPRDEQLNIAQSQVDQAKQALDSTYIDTKTALQNTILASEDIIFKQIDALFENELSATPKLIFSSENTGAKTSAEYRRRLLQTSFPQWREIISALPVSADEHAYSAALVESQAEVEDLRMFLDKISEALVSAFGLDDTSYNSYFLTLNTVRGTVNGLQQSLSTQQQLIDTKKAALTQAVENLSLTLSGATDEKVQAQEAVVKQAEAALAAQGASVKRAQAVIAGIYADLAKTAIRTPIAGKVAVLPVQPGELVTSGQLVASIVNTEGLQVRAYIDSSALSDVAVGNTVQIDGKDIGVVTNLSPSIDPLTKKVEIIIAIDDAHKQDFVIAQFVSLDIMFAASEEAGGQTIIPLKAIRTTADTTYVFTIGEDNTIAQVQVEVGTISGDTIEILTDISEYGEIISSVRGLNVGDSVRVINE